MSKLRVLAERQSDHRLLLRAGGCDEGERVAVLVDGEADDRRAVAGDRVGVALRNLRESSLHRGCMICEPGKGALVRNESSTIRVKMAPFQKRVFSEGDVIHAASDLQFVVGRVNLVGEESISVDWDSPLWIRSDGSSEVVLVQLDAMPMRIMGSAREIIPVS